MSPYFWRPCGAGIETSRILSQTLFENKMIICAYPKMKPLTPHLPTLCLQYPRAVVKFTWNLLSRRPMHSPLFGRTPMRATSDSDSRLQNHPRKRCPVTQVHLFNEIQHAVYRSNRLGTADLPAHFLKFAIFSSNFEIEKMDLSSWKPFRAKITQAYHQNR